MAQDSWQNKGYGEYFESLERQLSDKKPERTRAISENTIKKSTRKSGIYKVFRLRKSVLAVMALFIVAVISVTVVLSVSGKDRPEKEETVSLSQTVQSGKEKKQEKKINISYKTPKNLPDIMAANDAKNAIIVDLEKNEVIAARNEHTKAYPASTTKIMTLLVAAEELTDLNETFTMSYEITDPLYVEEASVAGFLDGEVITVKDLMYGTALPSGADAATALAILAAGNEENFVELMNKKVKSLGLKNTHFDNVTGLHSEQNYSSAYDMAVILNAAMKNELCREILSTYQHKTAKTPQNPDGILLSNTIFEYMYGTEPETATILGGKTGFVNESGYCIASFGKDNQSGNEYIVVTLGNSSRWPAFHGQIDLYKNLSTKE